MDEPCQRSEECVGSGRRPAGRDGQRRSARRFWVVLLGHFTFVLIACITFSCGKGKSDQSSPPTPPTPAQLPRREFSRPSATHYPALSSDPTRERIVKTYLNAWRKLPEAPGQFAQERSRLLEVYAEALRGIATSPTLSEYDQRLRLLWDLCGLAHVTTIPPNDIKGALGWQEPQTAAADPGEAVSIIDARDQPVRIRPARLPKLVLRLLRSVPADPTNGTTFADFVSANAREVYLTPQLAEWSPACPLDVCGSGEPLTRTLILASVSYIDLSPKPEWSLAAVAVHECAHLDWFHRPEVSRDPRLLLPVPNERNAWRMTIFFLRGLLRAGSPSLRPYLRIHGTAIRKMLHQAREEVRKANRHLQLPGNDESMHLTLPPGISEEVLRGLEG